MRPTPTIALLGGIAVVLVGIITVLVIRSSLSDRGTLMVDLSLTEVPLDGHIVMHIDSIDLWHHERGWHTVDSRVRTLSTATSVDEPSQRTFTVRARAGSYERIRISLVRLERITEQGEREPLSTLLDTIVVSAPVTIISEEESALRVSLATNASLYEVDGARTAFIPTIQVETRTNVTTTREGDSVRITGGALLGNQTFGMTPDGSMRANYRLPHDTTLILDNGELRISSLPEIMTPVERIERELAEAEQNATEESPTSDDTALDSTREGQETPASTSTPSGDATATP